MLFIAALLATPAAALAQFGPAPQPGSGGSRNTGPFGPSPQQAPPPQPYPRQPYPYPIAPQIQGSLVGVWSTTLYDTRGQAYASIFVQFGPDGRFQRRMIVQGGQSDVFGVWQYDPQYAVLRTRSQDYQPKNLPPPEPMGQLYTLQLQWVSANHFITQDASGPIRWVRQQ
jgi:hypothetical protein